MGKDDQKQTPPVFPEVFELWPHDKALTLKEKLYDVETAVEGARAAFFARHGIEPTVVWVGRTQRWWVELQLNPKAVLGDLTQAEERPVTHYRGMKIFWANAESLVMVGIMEGAWDPELEPTSEEGSSDDQDQE